MARWVERREAAGEAVPVADVAASFQEAVVDVLTRKAVLACREHGVGPPADRRRGRGELAAAGAGPGSAASRAGIALRVPRAGLCTDNGAMVAALGAQLVAAGRPPSRLDLPADSSHAGDRRPGLIREV